MLAILVAELGRPLPETNKSNSINFDWSEKTDSSPLEEMPEADGPDASAPPNNQSSPKDFYNEALGYCLLSCKDNEKACETLCDCGAKTIIRNSKKLKSTDMKVIGPTKEQIKICVAMAHGKLI